MNPKVCFKLVVLFALLSIATAGGAWDGGWSLGGENQRPDCTKVVGPTDGMKPLDEIVDGVLRIPCDLFTCLLKLRCKDKCNSELTGSLLLLAQTLLKSGVCEEGLTLCPDNFAVEKCLAKTGNSFAIALGGL